MKLLSFLTFVLLLAGCNKENRAAANGPTLKDELMVQLIGNICKELKREKNLIPFGFGGGAIDKVNRFSLSFQYHNECEIDEARKLVMDSGILFLKTINDDKKIRPHLRNYPFRPEDVEIRIFFKKTDDTELGFNKLHVVSLANGLLRYYTRIKETKQLDPIYTETFKEAAEQLQAMNLSR